MVGVVVATHGDLAEALVRAVEGICGPLVLCRAVTISAASAMEQARESLAEAIRAVDEGDGVLVLTDMFGGTPANLALTFLDARVEVVTGVNLPMVVKLSTLRAEGRPLAALAEAIATYGQKNISLASAVLRAKLRP